MSDIADRAQSACDECNNAGLARHRARASLAAERPRNESGLCSDCGYGIEPARLAADPCVERCVGCQEVHEQRERFRR